jgi:hypothetical protein
MATKKDSVESVLTPEEREDMRKRRDEMAKEIVAPPRNDKGRRLLEVFREGVKPPVNDDMGSAQPGQPGQPAKKKAKGGSIKSASARADGCCVRGKTRA